jgi:hypothetical protein
MMTSNTVAFSPKSNYTDWATATGRRILVPTLMDRGVPRGQRGGTTTAVNLSFLDCSRYFFFQVAPHLSSRGSVVLSPQANYTDWSTATCRRNLVPTFVDRWVSRGQRDGSPTVVNLSVLDRNRYFSFK